MYEGAKSAEIRQTELSSIHSSLVDANEKSQKLISEINESLRKIHPFNEPNKLAPEPGKNKPEEASLVNSLRGQVRFAKENADRLVGIVQHLNSLI